MYVMRYVILYMLWCVVLHEVIQLWCYVMWYDMDLTWCDMILSFVILHDSTVFITFAQANLRCTFGQIHLLSTMCIYWFIYFFYPNLLLVIININPTTSTKFFKKAKSALSIYQSSIIFAWSNPKPTCPCWPALISNPSHPKQLWSPLNILDPVPAQS